MSAAKEVNRTMFIVEENQIEFIRSYKNNFIEIYFPRPQIRFNLKIHIKFYCSSKNMKPVSEFF
jgi:hypothetical protein